MAIGIKSFEKSKHFKRGISIMISLGDLSKYNSSTIYKSVFNGVDVTAENKNALNNISTGINAFTTNPQKSSTLLLMGGKLPSNLSSYEWIIALFKAIADAKKASPTQETDASSDSNNTSDAPLKWGDSSTSNKSIFEGT
jgi:hypothetical protein